MSQSPPSYRPSDFLRVLRTYPHRWIVPAVVVALGTAVYAVCMTKHWEAKQTLLVRNEATSAEDAPGRFRDVDEMKVTQETILEVVKGHRVLRDALCEVGPASGEAIADWPSREDVAKLRRALRLSAPSGVEFGKTEISYLTVRDPDKHRALVLAAAVSRQLEAGLRRLRGSKAQSMIDELSETVAIAERDLGESTSKLSELERHVGADLGDLRNMELSATGDSDLRRRLNNIEDELRQAQAQNQSNEALRELLIVSQDRPGNLLATPSRLLTSQPALERLKSGLVAAQLRTSQLLGKMTEQHPYVIAARMEEEQIAESLHDELAMAIRGVEVDLRLTTDRVAFLQGEAQGLRDRLARLANLRPRYSSVLAEVNHRTDALAAVRGKLAAAKAAKAGAETASQITFVDAPILGDQPVGPSRAMILLVGIFGGLVTGLGIVFLTAPSLQPSQAIVIEPRVDRAGSERSNSEHSGGIRRVPVERTPGFGSKA